MTFNLKNLLQMMRTARCKILIFVPNQPAGNNYSSVKISAFHLQFKHSSSFKTGVEKIRLRPLTKYHGTLRYPIDTLVPGNQIKMFKPIFKHWLSKKCCIRMNNLCDLQFCRVFLEILCLLTYY